MNTLRDTEGQRTQKRVVEDTIGASIGAAVGSGLSALLGLAVLPAVAPLVPIGLIGGGILGVLLKEWALKHRTKQASSVTHP
jgi:hypothetical protein